jgi:hypothetical protein
MIRKNKSADSSLEKVKKTKASDKLQEGYHYQFQSEAEKEDIEYLVEKGYISSVEDYLDTLTDFFSGKIKGTPANLKAIRKGKKDKVESK